MSPHHCTLWLASALSIALSAAPSFAASAPSATAAKPNIVFIMCDDLGFGDLSVHGSNIQTPNVDRLARTGLELSQYYVAPVCTPTRTAVMSGRYWSRFGVYGVQAIRSLPWDTVTTPRALKTVGYDTALIGKWHLGSRLEWGPNHFGFDYSYGSLGGGVTPFTHDYKVGPFQKTWHRNNEFVKEEGHVTDLLGDDAVRWLANRQGKDAPFYLYVPFTAPHLPIKEPKAWLDKIPADFAIRTDFGKPSPWPVTLYRGEMARQYAACVEHMDYEVGRIVAELDKIGKRNNTLIVFTSDNGAPTDVENSNQPYPPDDFPKGPIPGSNLPLRGIKGGLYEGAIHVACFVNWPGQVKPGKLIQPVGVVDWMPTFCALAGYQPQKDLAWDGMNIWPFLSRTANGFIPRMLYCGATAGQTLRDGDWKLILWKKRGARPGKTELYDLGSDPDEKTDLASVKADRVEALRVKLAQISQADDTAVVPDRAKMLLEFGAEVGFNDSGKD